MEYATLMVHLELESENDARLALTGELAERFDATVIGIAACDHTPPPYYTNGSFVQSLIAQDRENLTKRMKELEERFRAALRHRSGKLEWRGALARPTEYVAREARAADLIITGHGSDNVLLDPFRNLDASSLVMQAGRPVLIGPPDVSWLRLNHVMVAWKDTREARRAVADALPLLRRAQETTVIEVLEGEDDAQKATRRVEDVAAWLRRHGVIASARVSTAVEDTSAQIETLASDVNADLIVAGAYGHHRLREWVFGGVTEDLLKHSHRCVLLAH
jgi:nucleotide-binding universal stress UspA family protein